MLLIPDARALAPLRILVLRALVGYVLLRALVVVIAALVDAFAGPGAGAGIESPIGIVVLAGVLGAVDLRRRGESILWADLGYAPAVAPSLFGAVALLLEVLLVWIRA